MCGGWTPCLHLFSHTKGKLAWDEERRRSCRASARPRPCTSPAPAAASGASPPRSPTAPTAGAQAAPRRRLAAPTRRLLHRHRRPHRHRRHAHASCRPTATPAKAKAFIDFQNDVTAKDIRLAVREGMRSIEHVKRYTTNGMATDQGKMSNINGLMIAADALGKRRRRRSA